MDSKLNKITCETYPDWYTQTQIDDYMECVAIGRTYLGDKMTKHDEYLIDIASKMSINAKYKRIEPLTQEMLDNIKKIHAENMKIGEFTTPPDGWYSSNSPLHTEHIAEILPHNHTSNELLPDLPVLGEGIPEVPEEPEVINMIEVN